MANLYLGINRGQSQKDVVTGSSTNSTDIELRIDDSKSLKKSEVIQKVKDLLNVLLTKTTQFQ